METGFDEMARMQQREASELCAGCGMCCDGTLFTYVVVKETQKQNDLSPGHPMFQKVDFFDQPCSACKSRICSVYPNRPQVCREFDCALQTEFKQGDISFEDASSVVRETVALRDEVLPDLRYLFESDDACRSLYLRFTDLEASLTNKRAFNQANEVLSKNSDALSTLLQDRFYPKGSLENGPQK